MNVRQTYVGIYENRDAARSAQRRIEAELAHLPHEDTDDSSARVEVLLPGRNAEALESRGDHRRAGWSLVRCHVIGGAIGLAVGALIAVLVQIAIPAGTLPAAGLWTAALFFGLALGMMAGGALFLRPPTSLLWSRARDESRRGRWQVVATVSRSDATDPVQAVLKETARETYWAPGR